MVGIHGAAEGTPSNFIEFSTVQNLNCFKARNSDPWISQNTSQHACIEKNRKVTNSLLYFKGAQDENFVVFYVFSPFWENKLRFF
jgi:hypothetical protein